MAQMSSKVHFSEMIRLLPVSVIIPVRSAFVVNMPYDGRVSRGFKPLGDLVTIYQLKDEIAVMASLQSPKKIVFIGRYGMSFSSVDQVCLLHPNLLTYFKLLNLSVRGIIH